MTWLSRAAACAAAAVFTWTLAGAQPSGPVVAVEAFTGTAGTPAELPAGIGSAIGSDLVNAADSCDLRVVEWERRGEVIREVQLGQSPFGDPATAPSSGGLLQPDAFVRGTVSSNGQSVSWNVQVVSAESGQVVGEVSGSASASADFPIDSVVSQIAEEICKQRAGYALAGTMDDATITGTICGELDKPFTAVSPEVGGQWRFTPSSPDAGAFSYEAANVGGVKGTGSGTYTVVRSGEVAVRIQLAGTGAIHSPVGTFSAQITEAIPLSPVKTCGRVGDR